MQNLKLLCSNPLVAYFIHFSTVITIHWGDGVAEPFRMIYESFSWIGKDDLLPWDIYYSSWYIILCWSFTRFTVANWNYSAWSYNKKGSMTLHHVKTLQPYGQLLFLCLFNKHTIATPFPTLEPVSTPTIGSVFSPILFSSLAAFFSINASCMPSR